MTPLFMREVFEMRKRQAIAEAEERGLVVCSACEIEVHSAEQVHCGECEKKQMRRYARMVTPRSKWTPQDQNEEYEERVARGKAPPQEVVDGGMNIGKTIAQFTGGLVWIVASDPDLLKCIHCGRHDRKKGWLVNTRKLQRMHGKCWRRRKEVKRQRKRIKQLLAALGMRVHLGAFDFVCDKASLVRPLTLRQQVELLEAVLEGATMCSKVDNQAFFVREVQLANEPEEVRAGAVK